MFNKYMNLGRKKYTLNKSKTYILDTKLKKKIEGFVEHKIQCLKIYQTPCKTHKLLIDIKLKV